MVMSCSSSVLDLLPGAARSVERWINAGDRASNADKAPRHTHRPNGHVSMVIPSRRVYTWCVMCSCGHNQMLLLLLHFPKFICLLVVPSFCRCCLSHWQFVTVVPADFFSSLRDEPWLCEHSWSNGTINNLLRRRDAPYREFVDYVPDPVYRRTGLENCDAIH